jgi:hypothetical protein
MGIKEGENLRCRFHGFLIGPDGVASEMPLKTERLDRASERRPIPSSNGSPKSVYESAIRCRPNPILSRIIGHARRIIVRR